MNDFFKNFWNLIKSNKAITASVVLTTIITVISFELILLVAEYATYILMDCQAESLGHIAGDWSGVFYFLLIGIGAFYAIGIYQVVRWLIDIRVYKVIHIPLYVIIETLEYCRPYYDSSIRKGFNKGYRLYCKRGKLHINTKGGKLNVYGTFTTWRVEKI